MKITARNLNVLCALSRVLIREGRATVETVAREANLSRSVAWHHLSRLRDAGLVRMGTHGGLTVGNVS